MCYSKKRAAQPVHVYTMSTCNSTDGGQDEQNDYNAVLFFSLLVGVVLFVMGTSDSTSLTHSTTPQIQTQVCQSLGPGHEHTHRLPVCWSS